MKRFRTGLDIGLEIGKVVLEVMLIAVLLAILFSVALAAVAQGQTIPPEVKQATLVALQASDTDGMHEEGFIWGRDAAGNVLIVASKVRPCGKVKCEVTFEAADPNVLAKLAAVDGFEHIHPKGKGKVEWGQPPSVEDQEFAAESPGAINIVVGSKSKLVYFFDGHNITNTIKLKDFLKENK
jgi:hypothetical protein